MTHAATRSSSSSPMSWCAGVCLALGLLVLAGCAQTQPGVNTQPRAGVEPITESDEPAERRRARIRLELAASYFEQGQTTIALDEIKRSLAADPNYGAAYVLRGLVYMRLKDDVLAEESFRRALQINPRDADAQHSYGLYVCEKGRYAEANELFQQALASPVYGGRGRTLLVQGICLVRAGQLAEAEAALARAYEFDAGNPIAAYNLASLKFRRGDAQAAQFIIRRVNNSELANEETLWLGIKVERQLGNTTAMRQLGDQLGRRFASSPQWAAYQRGAFNE